MTAQTAIPEAANEVAGQSPLPGFLGGPYGKGVAGVDHNRPTPSPRVLLTENVDDQVLVDYLNMLTFDAARDNGELALVACTPAGGKGCGVHVYIQPELGMRQQPHAAVPKTGIVVARIINYSPDTEGTFKIPPSTRAYWYVYPDPNGPPRTPRSRLFIRTPGETKKLKFISPDTTYSECPHPPISGAAVAKIRNCATYDLASAKVERVDGLPFNSFVRAISFVPGMAARVEEPLAATELWVKCAQGCCVSGAITAIQ